MNIVLCLNSWLSVSETFIYNQIKAIDKDWNCQIIALVRRDQNKAAVNDTSRDVHYLPMTSKLGFDFWYNVAARKLGIPGNRYGMLHRQRVELNRITAGREVDLIHAHFGYMGLRVLYLAKERKIPLITTFHGNDASMYLRKSAYIQSLRILFDYEMSYVIAVSERIRDRLISLGANPDRTICHYIGTDLSRFDFMDRTPIARKVERGDKVILLQVSNFVQKKGHKFTIQAFSDALRDYPRLHLILGGDGPERSGCEELVKQLGIGSNVTFLGRVDPADVVALMNDADIFVHNSITGDDGSEEGIPTVIMEAMATGLPVLSTRHAGIPELVVDGETGFLADEKDRVQYHQMILNALQLDSTDIGRKARKHVAKYFDLTVQNKALRSIYMSLSSL